MTLLKSIAVAAALCAIAAAAHANDYPARPVRFIVATPAGGNVDLMARIVGQKLGDALGRPFVIDNRGGAGGIIAEEITARSAPDGYTVLFVSLAHVVAPLLNKKLQYDGMKDLVPVSLVVSVPNVLVVNKAVPEQSVPELIALAKAKPGGLNYAASHGTTLHLAGELFKAMAGVDIIAIVQRLADESVKAMRMPDVRARLLAMGADPVGSTPEEFAAFRRTEHARVAKLVAKAGIKAEY